MKFIFGILCLLTSLRLSAQGTSKHVAIVKGKVLSANKNGLAAIEVTLPDQKLMTTTDEQGLFYFSDVAYGNHTLIIGNDYTASDTFLIAVDQSIVDVGMLQVKIEDTFAAPIVEQASAAALETAPVATDEEGISDQSVSGILTASRDPLLAAASFSFGSFRYQLRGYNRDQLEVYMNGLPVNDVETGTAFFGQWGGLNDVFRNQSVIYGLQPTEDGFGGLSGSVAIDATAAVQRKQTRVTYSLANRTYRHRLMLTHSTGMLQNGWAFSVSVSKRWAKEGYIEGTNYDGYSYYLGISKKIGANGLLHFTAFGAPAVRGKAMPATQEAMELAGSHFYNANWGYQNGVKRNARVNNSFQPLWILNYEYTPNNNTHLNIAASYQMGYNGNSSLDWYNAQDPRPDYYKYLPSNYINDPGNADPQAAEALRQQWLHDPAVRQINWDKLYETNHLNIDNVNGVSGRRSLYLIGEDRDDSKRYSIAISLQKVINEHLTFHTGLASAMQHTESYRKAIDLLGGDFYVNLNQFAERTYAGNHSMNQNDLAHPDGIIRAGDKYSYDYYSRFIKGWAWIQALITYNKLDFFIAGRADIDAFQREGLYKNGLFVNDSYGKSAMEKFLGYQVKGGITYKINGRNYLFANGIIMTNAPSFDNTFFSPRTRNAMIEQPTTEHIKSIEGGYLLRAPNINGRLAAFATEVNDAAKIMRFYHEDYRTFVNYVMQHINIRHLGAELSIQAKISPSLSATAVATWMQVFYTSRPDISIYRDNDTTSTVGKEVAYVKNYYVAAGPQSAYALGLNYRSPKYWYASLSFNFLDRNYVDVNPGRRTESAVDLIEPGSPLWHAILDQEKLPAAFTIDLFAGKSILLSRLMKWLPRNTFLYVSIGVNNILNNKNIPAGSFEQLRFDYSNNNPGRFPNKYFYGLGTNYFISFSLKL